MMLEFKSKTETTWKNGKTADYIGQNSVFHTFFGYFNLNNRTVAWKILLIGKGRLSNASYNADFVLVCIIKTCWPISP